MLETWSDETITGYPPSEALASEALFALAEEGEITWEDRRNELLSMRTLHEDWDGLGAKAPIPELVDSALYLLDLLCSRRMPPPSRIVASPSGSVVFEWQQEPFYWEVEIPDPGLAEWMLEQPNKPTEHWEETIASHQDTQSRVSQTVDISVSVYASAA